MEQPIHDQLKSVPLDCQACSLHKGGICLSGTGPLNAEIMIVGTALTRDDVENKQIFTGKAGQYLGYLLAKSGLDRQKLYLTNTVKGTVPPGRTVPSTAIQKCSDKLKDEITKIKPKVIILMGTPAYRNFQRAAPGTHYFSDDYNCWVVFTHHPLKPLYTGSATTEEELVTSLRLGKNLVTKVRDKLEPPKVTVIRTPEELEALLPEILANPEYGVDCETTGVNIEQDHVLTIGMSNCKQTYGIIFRQGMIENLQKIFSTIGFVGQHSKFDTQMLRQEGIEVKNVIFDDMLAHYCFDPLNNHNLAELSLKYLGTNFTKDLDYEELYRNGITEDILEVLVVRGAYDGYLHYALKEKFVPLLEEGGFKDFYYELVLPVSQLLAEMEFNGITIDSEKLFELETTLDYQLKSLESDFNRDPLVLDFLKHEGKTEINFRSPKQISLLLYKYLKIPLKDKKTATTDKTYLEYINQDLKNPVIDKLLTYRNLTKMRDTYVKGIRKVVEQTKSGRIHVSYHQTTTITGRLSCSNPNLQTIPKIVGHASDVRQVFIAPPGYTLMEMDFKQLEFRVWAHLSRDRKMIEMIKAGGDIHIQVAADVFNKKEEDVTKEERYMAKYLDFGLIYGRGIKSVSQQFGVSLDRAQQLKDDFFRAFPEATLWLQQVGEFGVRNKFVKNPFGRIIPIQYNPTDDNDIAAAKRHAVNYPIQGTAADLTNLTGVYALELLKANPLLDAKLLLNVHDAIYLEVRDDHLTQVRDLMLQAVKRVEDRMAFRSKLEVEFQTGKNLASQTEF